VAGQGTPATAALTAAGVAHRLHPYRAPGKAAYGTEAAEALGLDPARVFKTLVAQVDGSGPVLTVVPVADHLDLKALAKARGGKRAALVEPAAAGRLTGSVVGGISPLGSRTPLPVVVDLSALEFDTVYCSAGRRGLQMEVAPDDLIEVAGADVAELTAS
jgi:Cys-tRNA(Pro)/Cys-tRNA(Cys) deacylase